MTTITTKHEQNLSAVIHASTFSKYIIPFGNFILPLLLWISNKEKHKFVDYNGKQALNFQISMCLYSILIGVLCIPFILGAIPGLFESSWALDNTYDNYNFHLNSDNFKFGLWFFPVSIISGLAWIALQIINFVYTILATIRAGEGKQVNYPLTINFIK